VLAPQMAPGSRASLDESLITGESAAVARVHGEQIRSGSVNLGVPLFLAATAAVADSTLASMVRLLERAQATRPRMALAADRVASWFVVLILLLAAVTAIAWWPIDPTRAFAAVLAVLVVTCPCALSLATPVAIAAATARLTRLGVLVTRADAIERLARADTVVYDKTGTLTAGSATVTDVDLLSDLPRERVLAIAAALEKQSAHPLAAAFREFEVADSQPNSVRETEGAGIEGTVGGVRWRLGRRDFAADSPGDSADDAGLFLGSGTGLAARIRVGTPLRPEARDAIDALRGLGLRVIIASGDSREAVAQVARALGIDEAHARLDPAAKIALVHGLEANGRRVFVIGDGINDGPVLASAHVSCAMGQGSAIAQAASDLLLIHENLAVLPQAITSARAALRVVRQNLGWALFYNLAAVPLAAFGLVPPWLAALGMSLSSLGVVLNARRLARSRGTA
jgi:Cu2+-exporting ATPase